MSENTGKEDDILDQAIRYVVAASKGQSYKYPEGWDKNMKRAVRKRADKVVVRGVEVVYKNVINRAQSLLKKQFPGQNGLQSTNVLKEKKMWKSVPESFIQIIHDDNHWVCASNHKCRSGEVEIFDSVVKEEVSTTVRRQLATILQTLRPRMTMTRVSVQQQSGGSDCGVFAIAFAVALAHGQDPATLTFNQGVMREHLRFCLQTKKMEPFPTTKQLKFKKKRVVGRELEALYCVCRGIWVVGEDDMYQCSACSDWYHESCMVSLSLTNTFNHAWVCPLCS